MTTTYVHRHDSPLGLLTLLSDGTSITGLYMPSHKGEPHDASWMVGASPFTRLIEQLDQYFRGERQDFDVAVSAPGTPFQQRVWATLRTIPYGQTCSYRDIAEQIGSPKAMRAVGLANGRNPVSIIVPCHRVVGANGSLTGYGGGLHNKQLLLDLERRTAGNPTLLDQLGL